MICRQHTTLDKRLKSHNLKSTALRQKLLDVFEHTQKPLSAKDIFKLWPKEKIGKVTLYRGLEALKKAGLIKQLLFSSDTGYYESADKPHHHHLICNACGGIKSVQKCATAPSFAALKKAGFARVDSHSLEFFGLCKNCA